MRGPEPITPQTRDPLVMEMTLRAPSSINLQSEFKAWRHKVLKILFSFLCFLPQQIYLNHHPAFYNHLGHILSGFFGTRGSSLRSEILFLNKLAVWR